MRMLFNLRKQFVQNLQSIGFLPVPKRGGKGGKGGKGGQSGIEEEVLRDWSKNKDSYSLLKAVICGGLYPNVVRSESMPNGLSLFLISFLFVVSLSGS